ncbi:DNA gyrase subunit A [Clostridium beijerinckii]|jgi:DNA gyrase subunit A (EC 5.99.1.3)|uniref:DNA gyrase subunit A n=3 Tax=Clostridium beijerinckii TaxID=1520 RepID=A0A7Y8ZGM7_CLOBE|nr:DNA gyrase subunit A [Clostridium beijerinckii]ABR32197.1 DNA gyrase, A subunit [Clostridium beijerinckii NCIMB 8052]AIU01538.1 DNA gyrase subunit A [Clostridium beijerinckii ATCC 35702]AQS02658.1 DNA gyrase subunit A [Clostridium beijerinckii]MBA2888282.1 DNA gyrase subunit A [Clostridium beijerinckii]MBA2903007.1 DNA gyrase subunit A [Clostridium beijerinckii]
MDFNEGKVIPVDIKNEMKKCYIDYAMSVIVGRALPDVRDGLKPVHRRILYSLQELGLTPEKGYRKCARIVGDVLGKYHPHGDSSVYDALVRMAQDFSMRYMLVDGHGNFGSVDGDSAAAMRYTEAKMNKIAVEMLRDINKNTVDFMPNFDGEEQEPVVLPSRFPNLLVNGSSGIAVGMATNIPPHNLAEIIDGTIMLIDNPESTVLELMTKITGPDFPTGATIMGKAGIRAAYETGKGKIIVRANAEIEEENGRHSIIVTEIPYQVNKAKLVENIADLVKDKKITGISDLRDESDRDGMRIVIELKRDANPSVVLNLLYKHTKLQDTFGIIMLALVNNEPKVLNLKQILENYVEFQKEVITRRTIFDLNKAEARAHILEGLKIALDNIDEVISIIRNSNTTEIAKNTLMERFELSEKQSQAILEMRLRRLTGLERGKIEEEYNELMKQIEYLKSILASEEKLLDVIKEELLEIKNRYSDERKSKIEKIVNEIDIEDLIQEEDVVITLTHSGYIKRISADTYSSQRRGGKGIQAMSTKEDDFVEHLMITSTHSDVLFFTNKGRVYKLRAYEVHDAGRQAKGTNLINLIAIEPDEKIQTVLTVTDEKKEGFLFMGTKQGIVKKTPLSEFKNLRKNGLIAISLKDGDELLKVKNTYGDANIMVVTQNGYAVKFNERDVRSMGRTASGVKAINLKEDDIAVCMDIAVDGEELLVISENGYGKRTPIAEYKLQNRGGVGLITYKISEKTGKLAGATICKVDDELMLINSSGVAIRINVADISVTSRSAMGVTLMRTNEDEKVVAIAKILSSDDQETESGDEAESESEINNIEE